MSSFLQSTFFLTVKNQKEMGVFFQKSAPCSMNGGICVKMNVHYWVSITEKCHSV